MYIDGLYERRTSAGTVLHVFNIPGVGGQLECVGPDGTATCGTLKYAHPDRMGSVDTITAGVTATHVSRDPYGRSLGADGDASMTRGFINEEEDDDLGLINLNNRLYDVRIGRFTTPDPLVANAGAAQSFNRYAYASNSPTLRLDPSGLADQPVNPGDDNRVPADDAGLVLSRVYTPADLPPGDTLVVETWIPAADPTNAAASSPVDRTDLANFTMLRVPFDAPTQEGSPILAANANIPGLLADGRNGWSLINLQDVHTPSPDATPDELKQHPYHIVPGAATALQPLLNAIAKEQGTAPVNLSKLQVFIGTSDARGRYVSQSAIRIPTPGTTAAAYTSTLRSILHEVGHQIQSRALGEALFLERWQIEDSQYGERAYDMRGTLEFTADQFMLNVLSIRSRLGL